MNAYDKNNLTYMLSLSRSDLLAWFLTLPEDDMQYAIEVVQNRTSELILEHMELDDDIEDFSQAEAVIAKARKL